MTVQRPRGEAKEEKGENGGKMEQTQQSIPILLASEACSNLKEETEVRRGEGASEMVMVHTDEARRGSFNTRIKGLGLGFGRGTLFSGVKGK